MSRQSSIYQSLFIEQLKNGFFSGEQSINSINDLYQYAVELDVSFQENLDDCSVFDENGSETLQQIGNSFCFCFGEPIQSAQQEQYHDKLVLSNFLSQTASMQRSHYQLYYAATSDDQFYSIDPCQPIPKEWIPKERPWYTSHNQSSRSLQITDMYLEIDIGVCFTQTKSLFNKENHPIAIMANDLTMNQFTQYDQILPVKFMLIDLTGQILLNHIYLEEQKEIYYFQNVSKTGFNESDFENLLHFLNGEIYEDQCPISIDNTFCLFNKQEQKIKFISLFSLTKLSYVLISEFDPDLYIEDINILVLEIENKKRLSLVIFFGVIGFSISLFFVSFLINTLILQQPLQNLLYHTNLLQKNTKSIKQKKINFSDSNTIGRLNLAFQSLLNQQNQGRQENKELVRLRFEMISEYQKKQKEFDQLNLRNIITRSNLLDLELSQQLKSNPDQKVIKQLIQVKKITLSTFQEINSS
ncbi:unnamed protein product (macronuclear) [Paramecium tetraurelia]|uniref:Cache domain-containing protein n=1 Tax=Paramecium tetraurelia TaxID=5888 RepID=A0CGU8_PARTE|nr:uncharacterized protein GSPATT00007455001 [Paramecium tetraurelia]CAK70015.1 unnamed protein product [Paramecium tetraurelia]|eukprot:XP_001437412.1 hypothetical protein (macronuclear) [Paramecium tetraurelia strain d4-2]